MRGLLFGNTGPVLYINKAAAGERRSEYAGAALVLSEPTKARERGELDRLVLGILSCGLPIVGISPLASTHLPSRDWARHAILRWPHFEDGAGLP